MVAGWCALFMRPSRLIRSAIGLSPSTLMHLHQILTKRKYRLIFSPKPIAQGRVVRKNSVRLQNQQLMVSLRNVVTCSDSGSENTEGDP